MKKTSLSEIKPGYDLVVVGAGAAGCSFLYHLKNEGLKVLLVDYRTFPRRKACSGILVAEAKDFLSSMPKPEDIFAEPKSLDFVYSDWDHGLEKPVPKDFLNSYRYKLDNWLFSLASEKNFDFLEKTKVIDFTFTKDKKFLVLFLESNGALKTVVTKFLVGCDGAMSVVRKKLFKKEIPMYVAIQEVISGFKLKKAYFIYDHEVTDFYSWVIPKDDGVEVGSAVSPMRAKEKFDLFKKKVEQKLGIKGKGLLESHVVLRPKSINDIFLGRENVMLCGEAAVLISPSSAEGISYALRSGKMCAESFNENTKNPFPYYSKKTSVLIKRLESKFDKSKKISSKSTRKKLIQSIY